MKRVFLMTAAWAACVLVLAAAGPARAEKFVFGLLLVGPANDHGWSQAHYEAGRAMEKELGVRMLYIDKVNPADRPGITVPMLVDDLVSKGARLVIGNSDDMKDGMREAAVTHPDIYFLHISGDDALKESSPANLSNLMGRMEYGKMMAGFAAAMTTRTGKIGYLGPLDNAETRRLAVSAWLGARYAWTRVRRKPENELDFKVNWIGFWFNIPGVTADPTLVARQFFDAGRDVVISGIDTTEALVVAGQLRQAGKEVWAIPYDYRDACAEAPGACLGVPFFNWIPGYKKFITMARDGKWRRRFEWMGPDWRDINDPVSSAVGFSEGEALTPAVRKALAAFQAALASGRLNLFTGPLFFADGTVFLKDGETAGDPAIWNMPQLLKGM